MKKVIYTLVLGVAAWAGSGKLSAADIQSKKVAVPFAFKVDRVMLPAGQYRVEQNIGKPVVYLVNVETGHRISVLRMYVSDGNGNSKLTFEKTSQGYKLAEIS